MHYRARRTGTRTWMSREAAVRSQSSPTKIILMKIAHIIESKIILLQEYDASWRRHCNHNVKN